MAYIMSMLPTCTHRRGPALRGRGGWGHLTQRADLVVWLDQAASVVPEISLSFGGISGGVSKPAPYEEVNTLEM